MTEWGVRVVCFSGMKTKILSFGILAIASVVATAQPSLTIYNGRFAVVRDAVPLELKAGENVVRYTGATSSLEPASVILRDASGNVPLSILEQNYRNDPVTEQSLLERFEDSNQPVSFLVRESQKPDRVVEGRVIRSGYVPGQAPTQPIIDVDGKLMFELPGRPLFPGLKEDNILKPMLTWKIQSPEAMKLNAELAYLTGGLEWSASYNLVLPETGDAGDMAGWITIQNRSGKVFENAGIKLMAGDVNRVESQRVLAKGMMRAAMQPMAMEDADVKQREFDEFHIYEIPRATTLRDMETKQIEFTRASGIPTKRVYSFDPVAGAFGAGFGGRAIMEPSIWEGFANSKKVSTTLEFENSEASKLGIPLPAGVVRVYRRNGEQLEFVGEDGIGHTPRKEKVRLKLGNAFDLVGERKRMDFKVDQAQHVMDESFEITLRNQGKRPVQIEVVEHLVRSVNWTIREKSAEFRKEDSHRVVFPVDVAAESQSVLKYSVRYTW